LLLLLPPCLASPAQAVLQAFCFECCLLSLSLPPDWARQLPWCAQLHLATTFAGRWPHTCAWCELLLLLLLLLLLG
jgi:hypothetical protein